MIIVFNIKLEYKIPLFFEVLFKWRNEISGFEWAAAFRNNILAYFRCPLFPLNTCIFNIIYLFICCIKVIQHVVRELFISLALLEFQFTMYVNDCLVSFTLQLHVWVKKKEQDMVKQLSEP